MFRWHRGTSSVVVARAPGGAIRGAIVLDTEHASPCVNVRELLGLEPDALRTLLAHLAGYRGIFTTARWPGGAFDPAVELLRDAPDEIRPMPMMLRVLDPWI
jgi:predicted acetyltransferase